jgi:hypothetical protein
MLHRWIDLTLRAWIRIINRERRPRGNPALGKLVTNAELVNRSRLKLKL